MKTNQTCLVRGRCCQEHTKLSIYPYLFLAIGLLSVLTHSVLPLLPLLDKDIILLVPQIGQVKLRALIAVPFYITTSCHSDIESRLSLGLRLGLGIVLLRLRLGLGVGLGINAKSEWQHVGMAPCTPLIATHLQTWWESTHATDWPAKPLGPTSWPVRKKGKACPISLPPVGTTSSSCTDTDPLRPATI